MATVSGIKVTSMLLLLLLLLLLLVLVVRLMLRRRGRTAFIDIAALKSLDHRHRICTTHAPMY